MIIKKQFLIRANKDEVWSVFMDPIRLGSCFPGCKEIREISPTKYETVVELKAQFITISLQATGKLKNAKEKEQLTVEMTGKTIALVGEFRNIMVVNLSETQIGDTLVDYEMDVQMSGRLATMGSRLMKGTLTKSGGEFAENVQKLFQHT